VTESISLPHAPTALWNRRTRAVGGICGRHVSFVALYSIFAGMGWWLSHSLLPGLNVGAVVDKTPLRKGQIAKEIRRSAVAILIFGGYGMLTVRCSRGLGQRGVGRVVAENRPRPCSAVSLERTALLLVSSRAATRAGSCGTCTAYITNRLLRRRFRHLAFTGSSRPCWEA